tara:strand:+ start:2385 stop:2777 length:393 start_codon:yes stop_codon:yes gene_type:complete
MNVVIQKIANRLNIPCDVENIIVSYCYDECGYTTDEIAWIKQIKQTTRNSFMKLRLKIELTEWYHYNTSVSWLKPAGRGVYGKRNLSSVYGGGTLYESRLIKEHAYLGNGYIDRKIKQGDERRKKDVSPI